MRLLKVALVSVLIVVIGLFVNTTGPSSNDARAADACTIKVVGTTASINCAGVNVGTVQLPTVQVTQTLPPLPAVTDIVKVPGATKTVYVKVPGKTKTVTATKPSKTTTLRQPRPSALPTSETSTGQTPSSRATLGPATPLSPSKPPLIDFGDGKTTVVEASLGIVATVALIGLILFMFYAGYSFGFREADSKNARFIKDVLDENA